MFSVSFLESVIANHPKATEASIKMTISGILKNAPFQEGGIQKQKKENEKKNELNERIDQAEE